MRISSLEDAISADNQVRFIDAFVNFVAFMKLGFTVQSSPKKRGLLILLIFLLKTFR